jgi:hypothetical protein
MNFSALLFDSFGLHRWSRVRVQQQARVASCPCTMPCSSSTDLRLHRSVRGFFGPIFLIKENEHFSFLNFLVLFSIFFWKQG